MLRIGIFDKFRLSREGISPFVNRLDGMDVVLETDNSRELLSKLEAIQIDLLLMGIYRSGQGHLETARQVRQLRPNIKIFVVSDLDESEIMTHVIHNGLHGFMSRESSLQGLELAIRQLCDPGFALNTNYIKHDKRKGVR